MWLTENSDYILIIDWNYVLRQFSRDWIWVGICSYQILCCYGGVCVQNDRNERLCTELVTNATDTDLILSCRICLFVVASPNRVLFTNTPFPQRGLVWYGRVLIFCISTVKRIPNNRTVPYLLWSPFCRCNKQSHKESQEGKHMAVCWLQAGKKLF